MIPVAASHLTFAVVFATLFGQEEEVPNVVISIPGHPVAGMVVRIMDHSVNLTYGWSKCRSMT
jgi:hypothetical protein